MKPTHGGKRAGSGRKHRTTSKVSFRIRLEPEDADTFREICREERLSQSDKVALWVRCNQLKS